MTAAAADGGSHAAPPVRLQRDMGDHPGDHPGQTRLWAVPSVQMACRRHAFTHQLSAGPQNGPNGRCKCGPAEGRACAYPVFLEIRCQVLGARSANLASSGTLRPHDGRGQGPRSLPPWIFFKGLRSKRPQSCSAFRRTRVKAWRSSGPNLYVFRALLRAFTP